MTRVKSILYGSVATIALSGFAGAAQAADMAIKAPESIFSGVTFYGQLDVGGGCQSAGAPFSSSGLPNYMLAGTPNTIGQICGIASNMITQSLIGVKIEKPIGYGFTAIADISTGFLPISGEASNALGSIGRGNIQFYGNNSASFGDGGRDGQMFNGPVFAGLSSATFGTLTVGRISTLQRDNVLAYDPQGGAYAFSLIGFYGAFAGTGDTENAFWDGAIKYVYDGGPFHFGAAASSASAPTAVNSGIGAIQAVGAAAGCNGLTNANTKAGSGASAGLTVFAAGSNCAGTFDVVSGVIDYAFNKYVDVYTGVNWNHTEGGFSSGNVVATQLSGWTGLRLKF